MLLVNQHGDNFHVADDSVPENAREWLWNKSYMFPENASLEECWVATVCRKNFGSSTPEYEYLGENIYDHEPTKEELLWLMAHFDAVRFSYVTVDKALRYCEDDD